VSRSTLTAERLRARMGPGPVERLGLDLGGGDAELAAWLWACVIRAGERREAVMERALAALRDAGLADPARLAARAHEAAACLEGAGARRPEVLAARLARTAAALCERHGGSLDDLAAGAEDLEVLGRRLAALGPGVGAGTVARFLRPLRVRWEAAREIPLELAAFAAAVDLGWLDAGDDPGSAAGLLARRFADAAPDVPWPALEDALARLGRHACRRSDTKRCPLGADCPRVAAARLLAGGC